MAIGNMGGKGYGRMCATTCRCASGETSRRPRLSRVPWTIPRHFMARAYSRFARPWTTMSLPTRSLVMVSHILESSAIYLLRAFMRLVLLITARIVTHFEAQYLPPNTISGIHKGKWESTQFLWYIADRFRKAVKFTRCQGDLHHFIHPAPHFRGTKLLCPLFQNYKKNH